MHVQPRCKVSDKHAAVAQVLDVLTTVSPAYQQLQEVSLFLLQPGILAAGAAVALYVSVGGAEWQYRGYVSASHPSEVMPLRWPEPGPSTAPIVQLGVSMEPEGCAPLHFLFLLSKSSSRTFSYCWNPNPTTFPWTSATFSLASLSLPPPPLWTSSVSICSTNRVFVQVSRAKANEYLADRTWWVACGGRSCAQREPAERVHACGV